jgi:alpha-glucuronidase
MTDAMWLKREAVDRAVGTDVFYVSPAAMADAVGRRLCSEIDTFLRRPIVIDIAQATVVINYDSAAFDDEESFSIGMVGGVTTIAAASSRGALYGLYALIRARLTRKAVTGFSSPLVSTPSQPLRMMNNWDQADGSVERGYAGESVFFGDFDSNSHTDWREFPTRLGDNPFRGDMARITRYARFLCSSGINGICLNNTNVRGRTRELIRGRYLERVAQIAQIFSSFGIRTFIAVNFASPRLIGGLETSDPCDSEVAKWWTDIADGIYARIPDFGGFLVKADSEGEPGPMKYGRTHADGANMLAHAIGSRGILIWRTFVYNSEQDWRDRKTDRARAAFENFKPLDGQFDENVFLQVKFGPMDFQVREPLNPVLSGLKKTKLIMEFQITAEYLGHQIDTNYVVPQWKSMIDLDVDGDGSGVVKDHVNGFAAVSNVGMDDNWTGNALAQANLYGFGRMAWDSSLSSDDILDEWIAQTFPDSCEGDDVRSTIFSILSTSNKTYEDYCAPLGVGFMVTPAIHYGPSVDGYEFDRWGTYHFADRNGIGVDRTVATGSGYTAQYPAFLRDMYENLATTPDELLLFFHHVPYDYRLRSGETVIQHIYNTHFAGASMVDDYIARWAGLDGKIPDDIYANVAGRLQLQKQNAQEWRDQVNTFFYRMSGIADEQQRVVYK